MGMEEKAGHALAAPPEQNWELLQATHAPPINPALLLAGVKPGRQEQSNRDLDWV